jgi:L-tyrosine isonitrile synthase
MKWYRGEGTVEQGALKYYRMNMVERRAVELAFPRSIFVTFNGSKMRGLFPKSLPIFYMYSLRRGFSVKPWFLPADAARCEASTCHCVPNTLPASARAEEMDAERADRS